MVTGLESREIVFMHLKEILMLVFLKILVIFLICGDQYVNAAHFVLLLKGGRFWLGYVPLYFEY
jgi:hypothetical protein